MLSDTQNTTSMRGLRAALDIADFIQRDGSRSYSVGDIQQPGMYSASLCGMKGFFLNVGRPVCLKAYDLDVKIVSDAASMALVFEKGDEAHLLTWHRHFCAYQKSMASATTGRMVTLAAPSSVSDSKVAA